MLRHAIETFGDSVYRLAYHQLRSHCRAEDAYQETFASLYACKTTFSSDDHLHAWLMKVCANKCKNVLRNLASHREDLVDPLDSPLFDNLHVVEQPHSGLSVWDVVDSLSDELKLVIYLFYVEGFSTSETAAIAGISPATARTRLFRARAKIRRIIEEGFHG